MLSTLLTRVSCLRNIKYAEEGRETIELASGIVYGYLGQAIPTLFKKVGRTFDDTQRMTYVDKNIEVPAELQRFLQRIGINFAGDKATAALDAWGRPDTEKRVLFRVFENFISPGYYEEYSKSPMEEELLRVYKATNESSVLPKNAPREFTVDNEEYNLSSDEGEREY